MAGTPDCGTDSVIRGKTVRDCGRAVELRFTQAERNHLEARKGPQAGDRPKAGNTALRP